jgi:hypothetical protein
MELPELAARCIERRENMRLQRRIPVLVLGGLAAVVLAAGPAAAHECYNASRSDNGNQQIAAHSPAFNTFDETALGFFMDPNGLGLCPAGAQYLLGQVDAAAALPNSGIDLNWVVSNRTVQAGGLENASNARAAENLSNSKGIDHLGENPALGAVIGANIGAAAAHCGP